MPDNSVVSTMLKADLAKARREWLNDAIKDADEYNRRHKSDFLLDVSHEGEQFDFHALRHTCGAWLALSGAHPKAVQAVMRHSTITLTMDTYGHLIPGQEAETVGRLPSRMDQVPATLRATGTTGSSEPNATNHAQRQAQQCVRETPPKGAMACNGDSAKPRNDRSHNPLRIAALGDASRRDAKLNRSAPRWTRTINPLIKSQML